MPAEPPERLRTTAATLRRHAADLHRALEELAADERPMRGRAAGPPSWAVLALERRRLTVRAVPPTASRRWHGSSRPGRPGPSCSPAPRRRARGLSRRVGSRR
ncbi:MAG: hypothetical protein U5R31_03955 [Acidimicrobiia bacterium]|nr:hypothetical protein [Acidimicrobiia bacterium]